MAQPFVKFSLAQAIAIPNMFAPTDGAKGLGVDLDFTNDAVITGDLELAQATANISSVQSMKVDNSQNATSLEITFLGTGARGDRHIIQPYKQEWLPITAPHGPLRFVAVATPGIVIPIIFYNVPLQLFSKGPADGAAVLPALVNQPIDIPVTAVGDNTLIAASPGQVASAYRLLLTVDNNVNVRFKSGAGINLSGLITLYAGGSLMLQPNGAIPWLQTNAGQALIINCSAAVAMGGMLGYRYS